MTHDDMRELVASYALDAVSDEERRAVERHLKVCAECAGEAVSLRATAAEIGSAVPPLEAPTSLKARVLGSLKDRDIAEHGAVAARLPQAPAPVRTGWALAIAASLAAVLVGGYALALRAHVGFLDQALSESRAQTRAAQQQLAVVQTQLASAQVEVRAVNLTTGILVSPDVVRVDLRGQKAAPGALGRAFWSRSRGVVFTANALPTLPSSRVYQLWLVGPSGPRSAGLLNPDTAGRALLVAEAVEDRPTAFAVTVEPAGGVPAPTGDFALSGAL